MALDTVRHFIDHFVSIDYQEDQKAYGYNPFNFMIVNQDNMATAGVLMGLPSSEANYAAVGKALNGQPKSMFVAMDFPPMPGIDTDSVIVFSYLQSVDVFDCIALPYNQKTGERRETLTIATCPFLKDLLQEFLVGVGYGVVSKK